MKNAIILFVWISYGLSIFAQKELKPEQTIKFPFSVTSKVISTDRTMVLITDLKQLAMIDAVTFKVKWSVVLSEKFNIKKADYCTLSESNDAVWVGYKVNKDIMVLSLSPQTGEKIGESLFNITSERGKILDINHDFSFPEKDVEVKVHYKMKLLANVFNSSDYELSVSCDGNYKWTQTVNAKVMPTLVNPNSKEGRDFLTASIQDGKLFIVHDGFSVLDLASGKILWQSGFDFVKADFGLTKLTQEYPKAPFPVCEKNVVYVNDMHDGVQKLKALNATTGAPIWESEKYDKDAMISNMFFNNNSVINQFGGRIYTLICKVTGSTSTYISDFTFPTNGGFTSYDATSGKLLWTTFGKSEFSGLKKRSSNSIIKDDVLYVATEKELFAIDALTGKLKLSTPLSKLDIGMPKDISLLNGNIFIYASDGFAMLTTDGKLVYNTPTKEIIFGDFQGDTFVAWIGESIYKMNSFLCLDPLTGKIHGLIKDTAYPYFTNSGDAFIKFDGNKGMERYKIY